MMIKVFIVIGLSQVIVLLIILISYFVEKYTPVNLFIDQFTWKKSPRNARKFAGGNAVYYFIINLLVFIYCIYTQYIPFSKWKLIVWSIIVSLFSLLVRELYYSYQGIDFNKSDDDYS